MFTIDTQHGREWIFGQGAWAYSYYNPYWYSLSYNSRKQTYDQVFAAPYVHKNYNLDCIANVISAELSPGNVGKEIVTLSSGIIHILDGTTKEEIRQFSVMASGPYSFNNYPSGLIAQDIDNDGLDELFVNDLGLKAFDAQGKVVWTGPRTMGTMRTICQMDNDPSLEIVTSWEVVDITTRSVQWSYPNRMSTALATVDLNGDGNKEVLLLDYWSGVTAVDATTNAVLWNYQISSGTGALLVANFDETPEPELLLGEGQSNQLYVLSLNASKPELKQTLTCPGVYPRFPYGTSFLAMADPDADGTEELVWCLKDSSGYNTCIYLYDPIRKIYEWESPLANETHDSPCTGDITGDGIPELVVPTALGQVLVFDANTLKLIAGPPVLFSDLPPYGSATIRLGDVDGDNIDELCLFREGDFGIFKFDPEQGVFNLIWKPKTRIQARYYGSDWLTTPPSVENIIVRDVDGDGDVEILITTSLAIDTYPDCIQIYDYKTGNREWISGDTLPQIRGFAAQMSSINSSCMSDLNGDGHLDLLFCQANKTLMALDLVTKKILASTSGYDCVSVMPDGKNFVVSYGASQLTKGALSPGGYFRWATWQGKADLEGFGYIKSIDADANGGFYALTEGCIYYVDSKGQPRWFSTQMEGMSWRAAYLQTSSGTEVYTGWQDGISGFYTGQFTQKPTIGITSKDSAIEGNATNGKLVFSASDAGMDTCVFLFTVSGTAIYGTDYTFEGATKISGNVWQASVDPASSAEVTILPIDDAAVEGTESIIVTPAVGSTYQLASTTPINVPLLDNEPGVSLQPENTNAYEAFGSGKPQYILVNVVRTGDLKKSLTVSIQFSGTATAKKDYQTDVAKSITFPSGLSSWPIFVNALADTTAEATETVVVSLPKSNSYNVETGKSSATGFIHDGQPTVSLGTPSTSAKGVLIPVKISSPSKTATKVALQISLTPAAGGKAKKTTASVTIPANSAEGSYLLAAGTKASNAIVTLGAGTSYHSAAPLSISVSVPSK